MQDEIKKHAKKIYSEMKNTEHTFSEKLKEVTIEIFIIVFAVTLSIWLHSWSEHRHEQKEVKDFLVGLKTDIQSDIVHYKQDSVGFAESRKDITFKRTLTKARLDSLEKTQADFRVNYTLPQIWCIFNDGRYEGFKSSGKIELIENKALKAEILTYYQQTIPEIHRAEEELKNLRNQIINLRLAQDEELSINDFVVTKKMKAVYGLSGNCMSWLILNNKEALKQANRIVAEIDKEIND